MGLVVTAALSLATLIGCPSSDPAPKYADPEPLVVGKSPSAPIAVSAAKPATPAPLDESGRVARGNAPAIWLDSLTTPGKVTLPADKVVIVHFWATWCEPCKKAFPKLQELYAKYKDRGLHVIGVSVDDEKRDIPTFAKTYGARFPVGWDEQKDLASAYKIQSMPTTLVIDKRGNLAHTHDGYRDGDDALLDREINALF